MTGEHSDVAIIGAVTRAKAGDEGALAEIIELTQNRLLRFCIHLCGSPIPAEDLCQEALVKALKQITTLEDPKTFISWVFRIARNHHLDQVRRPGHSREVLEHENDSDGPALLERTASSEVGQDFRLEVRQALGMLETADRELLVLIDIEELSYAEVAEIVGVSESAIRSRLHRARKAFLAIFQRV